MMEFFVDNNEVWYSASGEVCLLTEKSDVVIYLLEKLQDLYPEAYAALQKCYAKSNANVMYHRFLMARRFCKCNFGSLDHTKEDVDGEMLNIEVVSCPLRGECQYEGIICRPEMTSTLSEAEKRVMRLVCNGFSNQEIAEELYLSPNTVKRHVSSSYTKAKVRNRAEFVQYANMTNLFNI